MGKFKNLTKYLPLLGDDTIGTWFFDRENDGSPEHPKQMPFVQYTEMVHHFLDDVYEFMEHNKEFELNHYGEILNQNGIEWGSKSMSEAEVAIRNIRRDGNDAFKKLAKEEVSEDEIKQLEDELQKLTDKYVKEIDGLEEM